MMPASQDMNTSMEKGMTTTEVKGYSISELSQKRSCVWRHEQTQLECSICCYVFSYSAWMEHGWLMPVLQIDCKKHFVHHNGSGLSHSFFQRVPSKLLQHYGWNSPGTTRWWRSLCTSTITRAQFSTENFAKFGKPDCKIPRLNTALYFWVNWALSCSRTLLSEGPVGMVTLCWVMPTMYTGNYRYFYVQSVKLHSVYLQLCLIFSWQKYVTKSKIILITGELSTSAKFLRNIKILRQWLDSKFCSPRKAVGPNYYH